MRQENDEVGYGKPPKKNQFKKGRSGNPAGRPPKEKPATDLRAILERAGAEEIVVNGETMTMREVEIRSMQRKAAKGDVAASRHLEKLRAEAGLNSDSKAEGGVLVVPGVAPLEEWSLAAARQQAKFRES